MKVTGPSSRFTSRFSTFTSRRTWKTHLTACLRPPGSRLQLDTGAELAILRDAVLLASSDLGSVTSTLVPPARERKYHSALQSLSSSESVD